MDAVASAVRVEKLPMASFSPLETSHGSGSSVVVKSCAAVGKTGMLLSTQGADVVSFILSESLIFLVAVLISCLVATVPGSLDQAQAERLLRGAENWCLEQRWRPLRCRHCHVWRLEQRWRHLEWLRPSVPALPRLAPGAAVAASSAPALLRLPRLAPRAFRD